MSISGKDKEGKSRQLMFEVLKTRHHTLMCLDTCLQLEQFSYRSERVNLVAEHSTFTKMKVLMEFGDVFSGVWCLPGEYHIDLDPAVPTVWGTKKHAAFEVLKTFISNDQLLAFYDVCKPIIIECDASTEKLKATLLQDGRRVASLSRSLTKSERNYIALELKCMAIVFADQ